MIFYDCDAPSHNPSLESTPLTKDASDVGAYFESASCSRSWSPRLLRMCIMAELAKADSAVAVSCATIHGPKKADLDQQFESCETRTILQQRNVEMMVFCSMACEHCIAEWQRPDTWESSRGG